MSDKQILEQIKKGDETALDFLYKKHYRMVEQMVIRNNGSEEEAKDIFQDALIVFWQKTISGELVLTSRIGTFIYGISNNLWRKALDRKAKYSSEPADAVEEMNTDKDEQVRIIHECLARLGDNCRKILSYYYFDGFSMHDIAEKLNYANADTIKTKKYKCKKSLDQLVRSLYSKQDFLN